MRPLVDNNFEQAIASVQAGRLNDAEQLFKKVLRVQPKHIGALNILSVVLTRLEKYDEAEKYIQSALKISANSDATFYNYGLILKALKRPGEALTTFSQAISINPNIAETWNGRGTAYYDLKRYDDAVADFRKAILLQPAYSDAYYNHGKSLTALKSYDDAIAAFDKALALRPDLAEAWIGRGNALQDFRRHEEALAAYDKALALKPNSAEAWFGRANALEELKRYDIALAAYDRALALKPDFAGAWLGRGTVFCELNRYDDALAAYDRALALQPDLAGAWLGRGNIFWELRHCDESIAAYERAVALDAGLAGAWLGRGNVLREVGRLDEAMNSFDKAIASNPELADAYWNRSHCLLLMGQFEQGWRDYEARKKIREPCGHRTSPRPLWSGVEYITGKTLLVHAEQGFGDTIHFCRYLKLLEVRGAKVLFAPQKPLRALLGTLSPTIEIVDADDSTLAFDYHAPLLSLPLAFNTGLETIPNHVPYLHAEAERITTWKQRIGADGFKIGICWQGRLGRMDTGRSFPVAEFQGISRLPGVRLISLHKGEGVSQLADLPRDMRVETLGDEFDHGSQAFLDTAAVMNSCDLIISSDTAVAHLAGALARPIWVALRHAPEWRWMLDRSDSPWYPSMRLFRQAARDDWKSVFAELENEARMLLGLKP